MLQQCTRLWSQEYIPPVFALLMHKFLLQRGNSIAQAGQYMHVLVEGAEKMFWLDITSGTVRRRA
jgi:hypothetical protein